MTALACIPRQLVASPCLFEREMDRHEGEYRP